MSSDTIMLTEPQVNQLIPVWTGLNLYKAAAQVGPYTLLTQLPYVLNQTVYTYVDPTGLISDWYEVARYGPNNLLGQMSTPWTVSPPSPPTASGAIRSLANYRRVVAQALNSLTVVTTDTAGMTNGGSVIASSLAGGLDTNWFRQAWLYVYDGGFTPALTGLIRRVGDAALNTSSGELAPSVPFPVQVPAGATIEIHRVLPPVDHDGFTGLRTLINNALAECWTYRRLPLTGVNGQPAYDLSTLYDWLDADAVNEVYGPAPDPTLNPMPWPKFESILDGFSLKVGIQPTFSTGAQFQIGGFMPLDRYINVGGTWLQSDVGLVNDSDQALLKPQALKLVALAHVYDVLAQIPDGSATMWQAKADRQRLIVNRWKTGALPRHSGRMAHALGIGSARDPKDFSTW